MADDYVDRIQRVQPTGPYQIGGYSFGGTPALEMCQRLRARGETIRTLLVFDHVLSPARYEPNHWTPRSFADAMANLARWLVTSSWKKNNITWSWERIAQRLQQAANHEPVGATSNDADYVFQIDRLSEQMRHYIENHYRILRKYQPR